MKRNQQKEIIFIFKLIIQVKLLNFDNLRPLSIAIWKNFSDSIFFFFFFWY